MFSGLPEIKNTMYQWYFVLKNFSPAQLPISSMHLPCNKLLQDFYFSRSQKRTLDKCFKIRLPGGVTLQTFKKKKKKKKSVITCNASFRDSTDVIMTRNWFESLIYRNKLIILP